MGCKKNRMFRNSMHDSEQFKVANICAFKKILVHSKVLQWEHRIYFNKGTRKRNGCLNCQISIKYFSESSMNKKKLPIKRKKHQLWMLRWWWIIISKDTLRVGFTHGFSSQIWILIKCNVMSKMCSKQKSINEMNYYRQNTWHFYFIMELG